jgi:hypothetical protein
MDTAGELSREQRLELRKELGRHYVVDTPPFEKCACGNSMVSAGHDLGTHQLEAAFLFGVQVGKRPKPRRKALPASAVQVGHELMSARRRILVTSVRTVDNGGDLVVIAGTYKARPTALQRTSTSLRLRPDREVVVMNWVPPIL